jgi:L-seryl-tRNA(Ser) seleniumtransferase
MPAKILPTLPSVAELLESPPLRGLVDKLNQNAVVAGAKATLTELRREVRSAAGEAKLPDVRELAERVARRIVEDERASLRPVVNATGVLLGAELGEPPLSQAALEDLLAVGGNYASVQIDLATGTASRRADSAERALCQLTGAEAALVVNNHAAALLVTLAALAGGHEAIVARGQVGETDGCRLDMLAIAGNVELREVGAVNRVVAADYASVICPETKALLHLHTSDFEIVGHTQAAALEALVELGRERGLPVIADLDCGGLVALANNPSREPSAAERIAAGCEVVVFSGSKLLGGPQCGLIVGTRSLLAQIEQHPLFASLRVDKLRRAALAATLRAYEDPEQLAQSLPLQQLLSTPLDNLQNRAERLAEQLAANKAFRSVAAAPGEASLGAGHPSVSPLPSWQLLLEPSAGGAEELAATLRTSRPPIIGRIGKGRVILDLRTVFARQDQEIAEACAKLGAS